MSRRGDKSNAARHRSDLYSGASPMQSPASENGPGRLGSRKGKLGVFKEKRKEKRS